MRAAEPLCAELPMPRDAHSVQGKVIAHAERFAGGTARLSFTIPKTAKGKVIKVKVTIKAGSQAATKIATFHVN